MPSFRDEETLGDWAEQAGRRDDFDPETAFQPIARIPRRGMLAPLPGCDCGSTSRTTRPSNHLSDHPDPNDSSSE